MNKSIIQGFAAGIIFTVAVIGVYTFWSNENKERPLTVEEANVFLQQNGYQVSKNTEQTELIADTENKNEESSTSYQSKSEEEQNQKTSVDKDQVKDNVISYQLSIQAGMTTNEIASILLEQNILKETDSFTKYMNDQYLNNKIQVGKFVVTNTMSVLQIANTITK